MDVFLLYKIQLLTQNQQALRRPAEYDVKRREVVDQKKPLLQDIRTLIR
jgi:hypothetical protein